MDMQQLIGPVIGAIGALLTIAVSFNKLKSSFKKEIEEEIADAIEKAKALADGDIKTFNMKIDSVSKDIKNLEYKIDRDIDHVKAIYNSEIKTLTDKIESLRDQMQDQHTQLIGILTKLVTDNKN